MEFSARMIEMRSKNTKVKQWYNDMNCRSKRNDLANEFTSIEKRERDRGRERERERVQRKIRSEL